MNRAGKATGGLFDPIGQFILGLLGKAADIARKLPQKRVSCRDKNSND